MIDNNRCFLSLTSWNIQSIIDGNSKAPKSEDNEFLAHITNNEVICLQETIKSVYIPGYKSYISLRQGTNINHGGVVTLVSNRIRSGVVRLCSITTSPDIVVTLLKKDYFHQDRDICLINVYISPKNSKYYSSSNYDPYAELNSVVRKVSMELNCRVMICGDLNSRIGSSSDQIPEGTSHHLLPPSLNNDLLSDHITNRNHRDKASNGYSQDLTDLLIGNRLHIANGRILGDVIGDFTCIKYNGASTVDYFLLSPDIFPIVQDFSVQPFSLFSDHRPIRLRLSLLSGTNSYLQDEATFPIPPTYKHTAESLKTLKDLFDSNAAAARQILEEDFNDAYDLNTRIISTLQHIADSCMDLSKPPSNKTGPPRKAWFDESCKAAKRSLHKLARTTGKYSQSDYHRRHYYTQRKAFSILIRRKRRAYENQLNKDIEDGKFINWSALSKIKNSRSAASPFDDYDIKIFREFFGDLYNDTHSTISDEQKSTFINQSDALQADIQPDINSTDLMNAPITLDELNCHIKSLKTGKSSAEDRISNEILKTLNHQFKDVVLKLFNLCLSNGQYPWNNSLVTPILKKGDIHNPDNYRAIAVGSCMGKLLSSILLSRIIDFKRVHCPDPKNQMGFTKGAQTLDHIFTIKTIADKYKKAKRKVYCTFVDFRKAFDSVCRQALLLKLSRIGIRGNIYNVIKSMYTSSTCQLKMANKLSGKIDILKGTEQGHTLSPELFKVFLHDLSPLLERDNCPTLLGNIISHLLWADDLVLMALDWETAQSQLTALSDFCKSWGLDVNYGKTNTVILNDKSKTANYLSHPRLFIEDNSIAIVEHYAYLGINIHRNGSFVTATNELRKKGLRALFGLRRFLDRKVLSAKALTTLFDFLIRPILSYGSPIWTPYTDCINNFLELSNSTDPLNTRRCTLLLRKVARTPSEGINLRHLKWVLRVHRKTSNAATWGEHGRTPLIIGHIKQTMTYYNRLQKCADNSIIKLAFEEQKLMQLDWYRKVTALIAGYPSTDPNNDGAVPAVDIKCHYSDVFKNAWKASCSEQTKLDLYNQVKLDFGSECYLRNIHDYTARATLSRLRTSSHRLNIELGRYRQLSREDRLCTWCVHNSEGSPAVESEHHMLLECGLNNDTRELVRLVITGNVQPHNDNDQGMTVTNLLRDIYNDNNCSRIANITAKLIQRMYDKQIVFTKNNPAPTPQGNTDV